MKRILRHSTPNHFDTFPYGTECAVLKTNKTGDLYFQRSKDENDPDWMLLLEDIAIDTSANEEE